MVILVTSKETDLLRYFESPHILSVWGDTIVHQPVSIGFYDTCAGFILLQLSKSASIISKTR